MSMPLNRNSYERLYVQLAEDLIAQMGARRFKARDRLPTEQELEIRADHVGDGPARNLGQPAMAPVLIMERTTFPQQDEPLEHTLFDLRSDACEFGLTVRGAISIARGIRAATRSGVGDG